MFGRHLTAENSLGIIRAVAIRLTLSSARGTPDENDAPAPK